MAEANQNVLDSIAAKMEAEGLPVPAAFKGKLTEEDTLLLHIFLDHLYMSVLPNLKQARKELEEYGKENPDSDKAGEVFEWMHALEDSLKEGYDIFANQIEIIPDLKEMKAFKERLEQEVAHAMAISLENLKKGASK